MKNVAEAATNVTVRYGRELIDFAQDAEGVAVFARTVDGRDEVLRCSYLAGCDGSAIAVRRSGSSWKGAARSAN